MGGVAEAEAAVVDGDDVDAGGVEEGEGGEGVGEGAGAIVEVKNGVGGVLCGGRGRGGNVPGGESGLASLGGSEADGVEGKAEGGGGLGDSGGGVEDELPVALVEEKAEGEPCAEECGEEAEGEGFGEPERVDDLDGVVGGFGVGATLGWRHLVSRETVAGRILCSAMGYEVWAVGKSGTGT